MGTQRTIWRWSIVLGTSVVAADPVFAHAGGLGGASATGTAPLWFILIIGGVIVGGSFLFTSLLTDHEAIEAINRWGLPLPSPRLLRSLLVRTAGALSVVGLAAVVLSGLFGPFYSLTNLAILVVWAGWWAGYTMTVYLLGNTWPLLNPWRAMARALARIGRLEFWPTVGSFTRIRRFEYPDRLGSWPAVAGLLALVWLEVVSPVSENPRLLAVIVLGYTVVTAVGTMVVGVDDWFLNVDPIANVFRNFGRLAPFQRTGDGIEFKAPAAGLVDRRFAGVPGDVPFIVALLWTTTYDGLVSTSLWARVTETVVGLGVPPLLVYFGTLLAGFGVFLAVYRVASRRVRTSATTPVTASFLERWFAPSLVPIAAGYHLAHFFGYFLTLSPPLVAVLSNPLDPPTSVSTLAIPGWYASVQLLVVLLGHMIAVWVAHALAFDLFPGRLQPVRSQYPFVAVMIFYTMTSMWIIAQPYVPPPYVL